MKIIAIACFLISVISAGNCYSSDLDSKSLGLRKNYLLAQAGEDDAFDPFSDYSEFDEATEEEADIHFFRNGRFLTIGLAAGLRGFTDNLSTLYTGGGTYGLFLTYFFDLRTAFEFGFTTGDHTFTFCTSSNSCVSGSVAFSAVKLNLKFYFNTQNVTKGVADLNPYAAGGFSRMFRTYTVESTVTNTLSNANDQTWGLDVGGGVEIPIMKKKGFFGMQFTFHLATFADANSRIFLENFSDYGTQTPFGYQYDILFILGFNF